MIITFLGHRSLALKEDLCKIVVDAIIENVVEREKITFYCGGYGDFDNICVKACNSIRDQFYQCEIIFVTPYIASSYLEEVEKWISTKIYDSIIYPPLENIPSKLAIIKRNEWMIDQSDLIFVYVQYKYGGAYRGLQYAKKRKSI